MPITELVYSKEGGVFQAIADLYEKLQDEDKYLINIVNVGYEVDIFASNSLVRVVKNHFKKQEIVETREDLAAILLEYDPAYRQYSGMGAQVLMELAKHSINMLECATTYSEIIIYIDQESSQDAVNVLKNKFL